MTIRTNEHFICPNGHQGIEKTAENDQPYSKIWESVTITGMTKVLMDDRYLYRCDVCGEVMLPVENY